MEGRKTNHPMIFAVRVQRGQRFNILMMISSYEQDMNMLI